MKSIIEFIEQRSMLSHSGNINEKQNFIIKGHTIDQTGAVDLDLPSGLKWASCNIGADKPEDYGLLFQWGRTDGYKYGDKNNKFLSADDYTMTSGTKYGKGDILKPEDDVAYQTSKGRFRMPTGNEIDELIKYTNNKWTKLHGVKGQKFISKRDKSKWIFIPAAGFFNGNYWEFNYGGSDGYIWSSSGNPNYSNAAYDLYFYSSNHGCGTGVRYSGLSVRGVLNK